MSEEFNRKEGMFPLLMTDRIFGNIERVLHSSPDAESVSWDLNPRSLVVRFKKPAEDKSKSIDWASKLADCVVQGGAIMANLYGEVLWHRERQAGREKMERQLAEIRHAMILAGRAFESPLMAELRRILGEGDSG